MCELYMRIEALCKTKGINITQMCKEAHVSRASLSELKMGRSEVLAPAPLSKIADYFGVTVDYLLNGQKETPALTKKDERDIYKKWRADLEELENSQDGLMFDGQPLDDETKELLAISLKNSLELSKKIAKQKYTPKKYRKQDKSEGD
ncbi:XRE family transcriptional regulator [Clostridium sp. KNHs216]|uniref:helix-turn-helix domain-containing protein n=1 Tax=Clostridium sp. KNHs216 TaxID=1550235 RepID=UPI00116D0569|nr:XRE family transcriptional regulator [Clostridium sp. KNHs216]TQI68967.1 Cro/C1-type helix-turn-helix DNA-binding protein [Clostridium sp. KNHs216]